ncbi:hypothetical protein BCR44DRAFT_1542213 [Catenaria anguillulae PL171]|uniref:AIG1-type G domain-containing protein n=1 Tax=Catenaria anguillulae PL171 TaxID=765915 RepID=A0A1Y2H906_9FUNG|nr:hypothetical protein BCR44DRAFT_1542213 [Catenaria anguillulae PL171]
MTSIPDPSSSSPPTTPSTPNSASQGVSGPTAAVSTVKVDMPPLPAPDPNKYQVVVIGKTGEGKSTLINTWLNYDRNRPFDNPIIAIPMQYYPKADPEFAGNSSEVNPEEQSQSQTSWPIVYDMAGVQVLDTPGFADCRGTTKDQENLEMIRAAIAERGHITAVILVMNGSVNRQTTQDAYVLENIRSLLPDKILENLVIVFTRCESPINQRYPLTEFCAKVGKPKKVLYMDNVVLGSDPSIWKDNEAMRLKVTQKWHMSMLAMGILNGFLSDLPNVSTKLCEELQEARSRGLTRINDLMISVRNLAKVRQQLTVLANDEKAASMTAADFEAKIKKLPTSRTVWVENSAEPHCTVCVVHIACETPVVCHQNCGLNEVSSQDANHFCNCACMSRTYMGNQVCGSCPIRDPRSEHNDPSATENGCGAKMHLHRRGHLEKGSATVAQMLKQYQAEVSSANNAKNSVQTAKQAAEASLKAVEKAIKDKHDDIGSTFRKIKELCSGYNPVTELSATIAMLQQEASMMRNAQDRKDAEETITRLTDLMNELSKIVPKSAESGPISIEDLDVHFPSIDEDLPDDNTAANLITTNFNTPPPPHAVARTAEPKSMYDSMSEEDEEQGLDRDLQLEVDGDSDQDDVVPTSNHRRCMRSNTRLQQHGQHFGRTNPKHAVGHRARHVESPTDLDSVMEDATLINVSDAESSDDAESMRSSRSNARRLSSNKSFHGKDIARGHVGHRQKQKQQSLFDDIASKEEEALPVDNTISRRLSHASLRPQDASSRSQDADLQSEEDDLLPPLAPSRRSSRGSVTAVNNKQRGMDTSDPIRPSLSATSRKSMPVKTKPKVPMRPERREKTNVVLYNISESTPRTKLAKLARPYGAAHLVLEPSEELDGTQVAKVRFAKMVDAEAFVDKLEEMIESLEIDFASSDAELEDELM